MNNSSAPVQPWHRAMSWLLAALPPGISGHWPARIVPVLRDGLGLQSIQSLPCGFQHSPKHSRQHGAWGSQGTRRSVVRTLQSGLLLGLLALLAACASKGPASGGSGSTGVSGDTGKPTVRPNVSSAGAEPGKGVAEWVPVPWADLPGWGQDALHEAWSAALNNCQNPPRVWLQLCPEVRRLSLSEEEDKWQWLQTRFQPYRLQSQAAQQIGVLTGYYEPLMQASRQAQGAFKYPLYQMPITSGGRKFTYPRREIDLLGEATVGLAGRQLMYFADPVDVLIVHIQGSSRVWVTEPDGQQRLVRLAFAGTNEQPFQSVARWLLDRGEVRDASWTGIKAWVNANMQRAPDKVQAMFWSNPRMVFFKEENLPPEQAANGPRGAQGVPLTPGRSIAVDKQSIPYGTPVWLVSNGPAGDWRRLVFAQDTGSAIQGAVRADYYVGTGEEAGQLAGRLKQNLQLWALWPLDARLE